MREDRKCRAQPQQPEKINEHWLVQGWRAAEKGEPYDQTMPAHWLMGYRIYVGMMKGSATRH